MIVPRAPFTAWAVGLPGWYFILLHALVIPWMTFRSRAKLAGQAALPPRTRHFTGIIVMQVILLALALWIARACGIGLYPRVAPSPMHLVVGLAALAAMLAFMLPRWRGAVVKGDRRLYFFMPTGPREKALWVGVSAAAAFGEETTYRGVLFALFLFLTGSWWIAALASAVVFGAAHAFQSRRSMAIIFCFSLIFQLLAIWTGALYVSMIVHFAYDVVAGFTYSRLGRELGFRAEGAPAAAAAN